MVYTETKQIQECDGIQVLAKENRDMIWKIQNLLHLGGFPGTYHYRAFLGQIQKMILSITHEFTSYSIT